MNENRPQSLADVLNFPPDATAGIMIWMNQQGAVCTRMVVGNRPQFNMMIETGKQDIISNFERAETSPQVAVAPPGTRIVHRVQ